MPKSGRCTSLEDALQRMPMPSGEIEHFRRLRLRDIVAINPACAEPLVVNREHEPYGRLAIHFEHALQYVNHKLHRRVVVIEKQHLGYWTRRGRWSQHFDRYLRGPRGRMARDVV